METSEDIIVSIAIPTYEMGGMGHLFLANSLEAIRQQTHKNIEVVISDHSVGNDIESLCGYYQSTLNIKYVRNEDRRGNFAANLNNVIKHSTGKVIKLLMQDDFLCDTSTIAKIAVCFHQNDIYWLATGCVFGKHVQDVHHMIPAFSVQITQSVNTIGSPSVLAIRNENIEMFNENLAWVVDLDYYLRLQKKFGPLYVIHEHLVFVTQHENQISSMMPDVEKEKEQAWLAEYYNNYTV